MSEDQIKKQTEALRIKAQKTLMKKLRFEKMFCGGAMDDPFKAYNDACAWLEARNISHGSMERNMPIGLIKFPPAQADVLVGKWTHLHDESKWELDGVMLSDDYRQDDVLIFLTKDPDTKTVRKSKQPKVVQDAETDQAQKKDQGQEDNGANIPW